MNILAIVLYYRKTKYCCMPAVTVTTKCPLKTTAYMSTN